MPILLWDASALAKRYAPEVGSDVVNALFTHFPAVPAATAVLGYAETFSLLLRKRNRGDLNVRSFLTAVTALQDEVIHREEFEVLRVEYEDVMTGVELIQRHNINASDAAILVRFARYADKSGARCILIASDKRLIRAAQREGLHTLDPETIRSEQIGPFLAW